MSQFGEPTPIDYAGEGLQTVPLCIFFVVLQMTGLVTELAPCLSGPVSTGLCVSWYHFTNEFPSFFTPILVPVPPFVPTSHPRWPPTTPNTPLLGAQ